ncbi:MAG: cytochrome-c oxidase, cbb3-type subunit III, partial [Alphaproteobacteria bacterium]|nr:cytochrome-c oxidase, cbb3-type subunit III [Alphaproteobacteria bacterium]
MALERDPKSGYLTTGHEWNGLTELNTPVPRLVFFVLIVAFLFSIGYWVLMPAWPVGTTYTKGLLGTDQRDVVSEALQQAAVDRASWTDQVARESFGQLQPDPQLMAAVR